MNAPPSGSTRSACSNASTARSARPRWSFFFQAEDGIRDDLVTGVQTCALPICRFHNATLISAMPIGMPGCPALAAWTASIAKARIALASRAVSGPRFRVATDAESGTRSEERRVGKEGRLGVEGEWWIKVVDDNE